MNTTAAFTDSSKNTFSLLKEWNFIEFETIKYQLICGLSKYLSDKGIIINRRNIDNTFGLAYTSSSSFAGLWACNGYKLEHNKEYNSFIGIVIDKDLQSYLMFDNDQEQSILIPFIKFAHSEIERAVFLTNQLNELTEKAFVEVSEYLKPFEGKKILTNSGLSKKIEVPTFQVREVTKYGFIDFNFWIEADFNKTTYLKTKICLHGGGYPHENFSVSTYFCTYLKEYKYIGSINKDGVYSLRTETIEVLPQFKFDEVKNNINKLKEKESEIERIKKAMDTIKSKIPTLLINQ